MRASTVTRQAAAGALLCLVLLSTGCGSRVVPGSTLSAAAPTPSDLAATGGALTLPSPSAPHTTSQSEPSPAAAQQPQGLVLPEPTYDHERRHNTGMVTITLSAACVEPGDVLVVTTQGPAKATVSAVIAFPDMDPHGAMIVAESDEAGRYVWNVPIEPTVPPGEAKVLVSSSGPNGSSEGGSAEKTFQVAHGGGCA